MWRDGLLLLLLAAASVALFGPESASASATQTKYPSCWIRQGECLDANPAPLQVGVTPQKNENVIGDAVGSVRSFDECSSKCFNEPECRWFTYYAEKMSREERTAKSNETCQLVGFNLKQACFNLEDTCVLLKECHEEFFDPQCRTCQTGVRPMVDPLAEPLTLILNGLTDDRDFKAKDIMQYSQTTTNVAELLVNRTYSCQLDAADMEERFGSAAAFVGGKVINCGGYKYDIDPDTEKPDEDDPGQYLTGCQSLATKAGPWAADDDMTTARAFSAAVVIPVLDPADSTDETLAMLGGYNSDAGFLDSIEIYTEAAGVWSWSDSAVTLPRPKSHFCAVLATKDNHGKRYLYVLGGWDKAYLNEVHRSEVSDAGALTAFASFDPLRQARSDAACQEVQVDAVRKGLMVAGGYRTDGAWMASVEFLDYESGEWTPLIHFPRLFEGRHYHGLTTVDLVPHVYGGWNNGSMDSLEFLDSCHKNGDGVVVPSWKQRDLKLKMKREKFASVQIPTTFAADCSDDGVAP